MSKKISQARRAAGMRAEELNGHRGRGAGKRLVAMEAADILGGTIEPLMPANLMFENIYAALFGRKQGKEQFKQARQLAESSDFLSSIIYLKELFFNDSFSFGENNNTKLKNWLRAQAYDFSRVVNDAWQEWLVCDNVVAFWQAAGESDGKGQLPVVTILDCEICEYKNAFGMEMLTLSVPKLGLSSAELARLKASGLDNRYVEAISGGKKLLLDKTEGDRFKVLTRAKVGKGLAAPRVGSVLTQIGAMDLLGIGDWAAASMMKKVIRQFKKGHEITAGPLAGQPIHFLKKKESDQIKNANKNKDGAYDSVTNFDVNIGYPFMDPNYFTIKKMEGTLSRLERWAGPIGRLLLAGPTQSPYLMDAFETEGRRQRKLISDFLASIFSDESFIGNADPPVDLVPRWSPVTFTSKKNLIELSRFAQPNGIASPQTTREWLGLNDKEEGDRLVTANKNKQRFTPPFEAKQGIVSGTGPKGGRPTETPSGVPAEQS